MRLVCLFLILHSLSWSSDTGEKHLDADQVEKIKALFEKEFNSCVTHNYSENPRVLESSIRLQITAGSVVGAVGYATLAQKMAETRWLRWLGTKSPGLIVVNLAVSSILSANDALDAVRARRQAEATAIFFCGEARGANHRDDFLLRRKSSSFFAGFHTLYRKSGVDSVPLETDGGPNLYQRHLAWEKYLVQLNEW